MLGKFVGLVLLAIEAVHFFHFYDIFVFFGSFEDLTTGKDSQT